MDAVADFARQVHQGGTPPEELALAIARLAYPTLDVAAQLAQLDRFAADLAPAVAATEEGRPRAQALLVGVCDRLGFHGNQTDYYSADNSYLNVVIERRTGLPILLCVVCMAIGRRLGLRVEGMGFPGHFMAHYRDAAGEWLLDPFHGEVVAPAEAAAYLSGLFHRPIALVPALFAPVTPVALAQRILANLRYVYLSEDDFARAAQVLDLMLAITPQSVYLWRERGVLGYRADDLEAATRGLRRYFFLTNRLHLILPGAEPAPGQDEVPEEDRQLLQLLQKIDERRARLN